MDTQMLILTWLPTWHDTPGPGGKRARMNASQGERRLSPRVQRSALCWSSNVRLRMEKISCWCCGQGWIMKLSHFEWWTNLRCKRVKVGRCVTQHPDKLKLVSMQVFLTEGAQQVWITAGRNAWKVVCLSVNLQYYCTIYSAFYTI